MKFQTQWGNFRDAIWQHYALDLTVLRPQSVKTYKIQHTHYTQMQKRHSKAKHLINIEMLSDNALPPSKLYVFVISCVIVFLLCFCASGKQQQFLILRGIVGVGLIVGFCNKANFLSFTFTCNGSRPQLPAEKRWNFSACSSELWKFNFYENNVPFFSIIFHLAS